jgi:hypothetical protein
MNNDQLDLQTRTEDCNFHLPFLQGQDVLRRVDLFDVVVPSHYRY